MHANMVPAVLLLVLPPLLLLLLLLLRLLLLLPTAWTWPHPARLQAAGMAGCRSWHGRTR
jgi:hypothetical protein